MGTRTAGSPEQNHSRHHPRTSTRQTRSFLTIRTRGRCLTNQHRHHIIPKGPTNKMTKWQRKTRTTTTSGIPFPKIHNHQAKLPHIQPQVPRNHKRTPLLVTFAQRNQNPRPSIHRSRQPPLLQRSPENRPAGSGISTQMRTVQYPSRIQTRSNKPGRRSFTTAQLQRTKPRQ